MWVEIGGLPNIHVDQDQLTQKFYVFGGLKVPRITCFFHSVKPLWSKLWSGWGFFVLRFLEIIYTLVYLQYVYVIWNTARSFLQYDFGYNTILKNSERSEAFKKNTRHSGGGVNLNFLSKYHILSLNSKIDCRALKRAIFCHFLTKI